MSMDEMNAVTQWVVYAVDAGGDAVDAVDAVDTVCNVGGDPHNDLSHGVNAVDTVGGHMDAMDAVGAVYIVDTMDTECSGHSECNRHSGVGMQWSECIYAVDAAGGPTQ